MQERLPVGCLDSVDLTLAYRFSQIHVADLQASALTRFHAALRRDGCRQRAREIIAAHATLHGKRRLPELFRHEPSKVVVLEPKAHEIEQGSNLFWHPPSYHIVVEVKRDQLGAVYDICPDHA